MTNQEAAAQQEKMQLIYEKTGVIYKTIPGLYGYLAGSDGEIYNGDTLKKLKPNKTVKGYWKIVTDKGGVRKTHRKARLIAASFIPNPEDKPEVNHKDGNKLNDLPENLEWNTRSENAQHAYSTGLMDKTCLQPSRKVTCTDSEGTELDFDSICEAMRILELKSNSCISKACRGVYKQYKGYTWRYKNEQ